jgi:hypothetical protein
MFTPATKIITTKCHTHHHLQLFLPMTTSFDNLLKRAYLIYHNIFIFVSDLYNLGLIIKSFHFHWQLARPPVPEFVIIHGLYPVLLLFSLLQFVFSLLGLPLLAGLAAGRGENLNFFPGIYMYLKI